MTHSEAMTGHLGQRGDAWHLHVHLGIDPVTGKQQHATQTFQGGNRDAQRLLAEMVLDAERRVVSPYDGDCSRHARGLV